MVYYLNEMEQKFLTVTLRQKARINPIPEELRGWNWHSPPLKPYYELKLPMYLICSSYCSTARDCYLIVVKKLRGEENFWIKLGKVVHETVANAIREARKLNFNATPKKNGNEHIDKVVELLWDYTISACKSAYLKAKAEQPYASDDDVILTSMPFLVEHRMDGSMLGCSGIISVDCYDYLRNIVFDLKLGEYYERSKLYTTGYALVLESIYEIPVDIGCVVNVNFYENRLSITKTIHYIDANLRSWWIEERDRKAEIIYKEVDPGKAGDCNPSCMFKAVCL
ncbi:MAG: type I-A CRISPR-associated protein Cas4/Csa1 [Archaeoglobaceae archaeon]